MTTHLCYEWSIANSVGLQDIVVAGLGDTIIFPHVSSCCAFLFIYKDKVLGGHATVEYPGHMGAVTEATVLESAKDMLTRMRSSGGAVPGWIVSISSAQDWSSAIFQALAEHTELCDVQYGSKAGVLEFESDIFYHCNTTKLQAQTWVKPGAVAGTAPVDSGVHTFNSLLSELSFFKLSSI